MAEYSDKELAEAVTRTERNLADMHPNGTCIGCDLCTEIAMLNLAAIRLTELAEGLVAKSEVLEFIAAWDREIDNRQQNDMPGFVRHYTPTLLARIEEL